MNIFIILLCVVAVVSSNSNHLKSESINPYDLEDELREQLEELRSLVKGNLFIAVDSLDSMLIGVKNARNIAMTTATLAIEQEYEMLSSQITAIKELAEAAGAEIGICLVFDVPVLDQLQTDIINSLNECLEFSNAELAIIQRDSKYRLNILINEVNIFDFQLELCAGDLLCLTPLATQIELAMVNIPQKIIVQGRAASDLHEQLKVNIKQCCDDKVAQFNLEGGEQTAKIIACANNIMS